MIRQAYLLDREQTRARSRRRFFCLTAPGFLYDSDEVSTAHTLVDTLDMNMTGVIDKNACLFRN